MATASADILEQTSWRPCSSSFGMALMEAAVSPKAVIDRDAWPDLPEAIQAGIVALVKVAHPQSEVER